MPRRSPNRPRALPTRILVRSVNLAQVKEARPASDAEPESWAARARELFLGPKELAEAPVTRALVAVNVLVYVACVLHARSPRAILVVPQDTLLVFGANLASLTVGDRRIEALLASCFLHFDILHLAFNLIALRSVGPFVERSVGPARLDRKSVV